MKKALFLAIISALLCCCTNSFMKKPISEALTAKEIQKFPSIIEENGDSLSGEEIYEGIRDCVEELFNKPSNQLSVNESKAIALCDKITYQDLYDFLIEFDKIWNQVSMENAKKLNYDPKKDTDNDLYLEHMHLTERDCQDKLQTKYPDISFLLQTIGFLDF